MTDIEPRDFYSSTMPEADEKFVAACNAAGGEATFHRCPVAGPDGEPLHMAELLVGPRDAKTAILLASGTHGIEGYAGAGLQVGLLSTGALRDLPNDTAVLIVHMVNPWGCAWDRREDQNNVDIFRNLVYAEPPFRSNPEYDAIDGFLNPTEWTGPVKEKADAELAAFIDTHGQDRFIEIMRWGQHNHPRGMTYHGTEPTWSRLTVEDIVRRNLQAAGRVAAVDLHTGLGGWGQVVVVSYAGENSSIGRRFQDWYPGETIHFAGDDPGIPRHQVMALESLKRIVPGAEFFGVGLEWGAEPIDGEEAWEVFRHMSWLQNYGDLSSREAEPVRRKYRSYLYGETDEWKQKAWENGLRFWKKTVAGTEKWSVEG
jgi:hypothetical protein